MAKHGKKEKREKERILNAVGKPLRIMRRHKQLVQEEMSGKVGSRAKAMRDKKYSESYIDSGHITKTKSFKALADVMMPNDYLLKRNKWLTDHRHWGAVSSGLDKIYKAKHIYSNGVEIHTKYTGVSREELERIIAGRIGGSGRGNRGAGKTG